MKQKEMDDRLRRMMASNAALNESAAAEINEPFSVPEAPYAVMGNTVVLKYEPLVNKAGLVMPDSMRNDVKDAHDEPRRAHVVACGCQCRYVRQGDVVLIATNLGGRAYPFSLKGERLVLVNEDALFCILGDRNGNVPEFRVLSWQHQIIERRDEGFIQKKDIITRMWPDGTTGFEHATPLKIGSEE